MLWHVVNVSPEIVDYYALGYTSQRLVFFSQGWWYAFYSDWGGGAGDFGYKMSRNCLSWSSFIVVFSGYNGSGDNFTLWYEDGIVYLLYVDPPFAGVNALYLRKGTVLDGTGGIIWDASVKIWEGGGSYSVTPDGICKLPNGNLFVSFSRRTGAASTSFRVFGKYSTDDGVTWLPAGLGNAQMISPDAYHTGYTGTVLPLTDEYAIYIYASRFYLAPYYVHEWRARCWNGTTLQAEENISGKNFIHGEISAVQTFDGRIHFVCCGREQVPPVTDTYEIDHFYRSAGLGGTWNLQEAIATTTGIASPRATLTRDGEDLIAHYADEIGGDAYIYEIFYTPAGGWGVPTQLGNDIDDSITVEEIWSNYATDLQSEKLGVFWGREDIWSQIQTSPLIPRDFGSDLIIPTTEECGRIVEWRENKGRPIPIKRIYSKCSPTSQARFHTSEPKTYTIVFRGNDSRKTEIESTHQECLPHAFYYGSTFTDNVWIEDVDFVYDSTTVSQHWLIRLILICISP